jgi:hypothetical protein
MTNREARAVHVCGDPTVDWMLAAAPGPAVEFRYVFEQRTPVGPYAQAGGAALLTSLLADSLQRGASGSQVALTGVTLPSRLLNDPRSAAVTRTFSVWGWFPRKVGDERCAWRMREFLGLQSAGERRAAAANPECATAPSCLVIDDTNLGFRRQPESWPGCLRGQTRSHRPAQIILKMTNPLTEGKLWRRLADGYADVLTVYFLLGDFRKEDARIGQSLSWEQISTDIVQAVRGHKELARAARVVVPIGVSGAVVIERGGSSFLVFDPCCQEGDWERERPGGTMGLGTCVVASMAVECARDAKAPNWLGAVERGLQAGRMLHEQGFGPTGDRPDAAWSFPIEAVAEKLGGDASDEVFHCVEIPTDERWEIVAHSVPEGYEPVANEIVVHGPSEACRGAPVEQMGHWMSVDRTEIESMRSVRNIIREYVSRAHPARPLSIAVFGPPGAGKSFAIKQMAKEWSLGGTKVVVLEFNLSQFQTADELTEAFQRLRDCVVEGCLPLVFWDEFDAPLGGEQLGWLPQFLAPMQDGGFVDRGVFRPIGPAVFVFAGGIHATMESFKTLAADRPEAKATDFLSRLRGFVDILGPNPGSSADSAYVLRRAFLLRSLLRARAPHIFDGEHVRIDPGVLRAFLGVAAYVHGARSMESIIDMSALSGKLRYERSALPAPHQLGLHVDAEQFLALVKGAPPSEPPSGPD